jgi:hypothetical protein
VELTPKSGAALDAVTAANSESEQQATNRAIQLYRLMCQRQAGGEKLLLSRPDGDITEIVMP